MYGSGQGQERDDSIIHIEGDPDHPVNRGTLCPKGAFLDSHSPNRLKYPEVREAAPDEWKRVSWDDALSASPADEGGPGRQFHHAQC